jgi:hypothetical protein
VIGPRFVSHDAKFLPHFLVQLQEAYETFRPSTRRLLKFSFIYKKIMKLYSTLSSP